MVLQKQFKTPLVRARGLGKRIGATNLYVKNDAVCFPTLSFKDRVVSVALANAQAFGFTTVGCSSTGNLANSVAAQAARLGYAHASWCHPTWSLRRF
jgi:threonine synthase